MRFLPGAPFIYGLAPRACWVTPQIFSEIYGVLMKLTLAIGIFRKVYVLAF